VAFLRLATNIFAHIAYYSWCVAKLPPRVIGTFRTLYNSIHDGACP
jgi:hypothetical protein